MSKATLTRPGGLAAILAGLLRGIASFVPGSARGVEILYFITDVFIFFGVIGLYGFQRVQIGLAGRVGLVVATIAISVLIGHDVALISANAYPVGALVFALGLDLFAIDSLRTRNLPRWIPIFWILSTIVGPVGYFAPGFAALFVISGLLFGVAFAGAGLLMCLQHPRFKNS